jgi:LuxR family maltose regulon positive regulatory protein
MDVDLPRRDVEILQNRTEGWAAGLYLAGLALRDMDNRQRQSFIGAFQGTQKYIIDYLVEEVLALADEGLSRFLCQTAAADRFNADLCNALTGRQDSAELLVQLEKRNFFIFPLDENRQWYRYHSLFRDILRSELSTANKRELHQKAACWLEENGFAEEAVKQAEAAGDYDHAILLLSRIVPQLIRDGELNTLLIRLNELPEHVRFSDTSLVISHAWCLMLTGKPREAAHLAGRIQKEKLALTASDSIAMLNVLLMYLQVSCRADCVFSLKQAVEQLLEEKAELKAYLMHAAAQRFMMQGKIQEAELKFMEAYHQARLDHQFHIALLSAKDAAMTLLVLGKKRECDRFCKQVMNRCGSEGTLAAPLASMMYLPMAASSLAGNNLGEALRFMEEALPVYRQMSMEYLVIQAEHQLAAILHASNRTAEALIMISDVAESLKELDFEQAMGFTKAVEAEFLLAEGKTSLAMQLMQSTLAQVDSPISQVNERQAFAYAKFLIACLRYDEARRLLARLETALTEGGRNYRLVTVYLMQSILYHRQNQHALSAERMEKALGLAADEGLFRPFLDEGQDMHGILKGIKTSWPDFAGKILDMSTVDSIKPQASARNGQESVKWAALQENLSEREIEVLKLASDGCSNQDIARTLYITLGTVKWHMNNIFSKLGTSRRTQAIAKARELNLL